MSFGRIKDLSNQVFFKENFLIDDYLSKCTQKSDLLTLRDDLKSYGQNIYLDMISILKSETDNIINLAENLTNLSTKIDDLAIPAAQLKEETRGLYLAIHNFELSINEQLLIADALTTKQDTTNLRSGILSSSNYIKKIIELWDNNQDIITVERAVNEYSFQYLYSCQLGISQENVESIAIELIAFVNIVFLKALKRNDSKFILRCLIMYANLNKHREAEIIVRQKLVKPMLSKWFTQSYLEENHNNIQLLFYNAIKFYNTDLSILQEILNMNPDIRGFNFVVNSFWLEIDQQLCEKLSSIINPGNPEFFQSRYQATQKFIKQIIAVSGIPSLFKTDPSFSAHMKRFNLPVYFEIRFQQIAGAFETSLMFDPTTFDETHLLQDCVFTLDVSQNLWNCIKRCLHEDVYLIPLTDQLLKLIMLLVSRYLSWYKCAMTWPAHFDDAKCLSLEKFAMYTLIDISVMKKFFGFSNDGFECTDPVFQIIPHLLRVPLTQAFITNNYVLNDLVSILEAGILNFKVRQCVALLQQVSAIPRIYRRTNRGIPKEHSSYVHETILILNNFYSTYRGNFEDQIVEILDTVVAKVTNQYMELVQDVLKSVCKTEDSLKRLKNRNVTNGDEALESLKNEIPDETKIREQIKLDVRYFSQQLQTFAKHSSQKFLTKLLKVSGANPN